MHVSKEKKRKKQEDNAVVVKKVATDDIATRNRAISAATSRSEEREMLSVLLRFISSGGSNTNMTLDEFLTNVPPLLDYLKSTNTMNDEMFFNQVSKETISQILLVPAFKQLLYVSNACYTNQTTCGSTITTSTTASSDRILWEVTAVSLSTLLQQRPTEAAALISTEDSNLSSKRPLSNNLFQQSTLLKIIPFGLHKFDLLLQQKEDETSAIPDMHAVATTLCHILPFFHPTNILELLVSWVQKLVALQQEHDKDERFNSGSTAIILDSILIALLQRFLQHATTTNAQSSTKSIFTHVLKLLIPLSYLYSSNKSTAVTANRQPLIQGILNVGLFHPRYHLEGYYNCTSLSSFTLDNGINDKEKCVKLSKKDKKKQKKGQIEKNLEELVAVETGGATNALTKSLLDKSINSPRASKKNEENEELEKGSTEVITIKQRGSCYQQQFFTFINNNIVLPLHKEKEEKSFTDVSSVIQFLPQLVLSFIQQTLLWQKEKQMYTSMWNIGTPSPKQNNTYNKREDSVTKLQFQFWTCMASPLLDILTTDVNTIITDEEEWKVEHILSLELESLKTLESLLDLVLKHQLYVQSSLTTTMTTVLQEFSLRFLRRCATSKCRRRYSKANAFMEADTYSKEISILHKFMELNPILFKEQLSDVITICVTYFYYFDCPQPKISSSSCSRECDTKASHSKKIRKEFVCTFFSFIIQTYGKLRQVEYLFQSLFQAMDLAMNSCSGSVATPSMFHHLLREQAISMSFSSLIFNCPLTGIESLWNLCNQWIVEKCCTANRVSSDTGRDEEVEEGVGVKWGVDFLILFTRSLRINQHTSRSLEKLCEFSFYTCIPQLVGSQIEIRPSATSSTISHNLEEMQKKSLDLSYIVSSDGNYLEHGLLLCGWLIDLHSRCSFWTKDVCHLDENIITAVFKINDNINRQKTVTSKGIPDVAGFIMNAAMLMVRHEGEANVNLGQEITAAVNRSEMPKCNYVPLHRLLGTLQHISYHRMQQLHAVLYLHQQQEIMDFRNKTITVKNDSSGDRMSERITREIRILVDLMFLIASWSSPHTKTNVEADCSADAYNSIDQFNTLSPWMLLAQSVVTWAPYATEHNVQLFLTWLFNHNVLKERHLGIDRDNNEKEQVEDATVISLLQDKAVIEVQQIADFLMPVGISIVMERIRGATLLTSLTAKQVVDLDSTGLKRNLQQLDHMDILSSPLDSTWKPIDIFQHSHSFRVRKTELPQVIKLPNRSSSYDIKKRLQMLQHAEKVLKILTSMNHQYIIKKHSIVLDSAFRLDIFLRIHLLYNSEAENLCRNTLCKLLCFTRILLARCFDCVAIYEWVQKHDVSTLPQLFTSFYESIFSIQLNDLIEDSIKVMVSKSTIRVLEEVFQLALLGSKTDRPIWQKMLEAATTLFPSMKTDNIALTTQNAMVVRCLLRKIVLLPRNKAGYLSRKVLGDPHSIGQTCCKFIVAIRCCFLNSLLNIGEYSVPDANLLLLYSDLLQFVGVMEDQYNFVTMGSGLLYEITADDLLIFLKKLMKIYLEGDDHVRTLDSAITYFIASVCGSSIHLKCIVRFEDFIIIIFKMIKKQYSSFGHHSDPLLDSSFCCVIRNSDVSHLEYFTSFLISYQPNTDYKEADLLHTASALHTLRLALLAAKGQGHRDVLAKTISSYWGTALGIFQPFSSKISSQQVSVNLWLTRTALGLDFFLGLLEKSDVMTIKDREIALVLSRVSRLFPQDGLEPDFPALLFSRCCTLLATCLKRHPKHIYSCVPSCFSLVRTFFLHLLNTKSAIDSIFNKKVADFTRLCEMFPHHKDVFKKHVIGIILDFASSLKTGMTAEKKSVLLPSVHVLLEVCSAFEKQQLNVLMDSETKVLFRTVFQNYQKLHQYKGQY